jgi:hypothetical protein
MMQRKKIRRMDVVDCLNHSNTAEGSKPLTDPLSMNHIAKRDSLAPCSRRNVRKALLSAPSTSSACDFVSSLKDADDDDDDFMLDSDLLCSVDQPSFKQSEEIRQTAANGMQNVGFVSARQYMNPTDHVLDELLNTEDNSSACSSSQKSCPRPALPLRQNSRNALRLPAQKNSLDKYFKPTPSASEVQSSRLSAGLEWQTDKGCDAPTSGVRTPSGSPSKTVMTSPLKKLPGSNGLYSCVSASQIVGSQPQPDVSSNSVDVLGQCVNKRVVSEVSKLSDDDFDFGYRMIAAKLTCTRQSLMPSAKSSKGKNSGKAVKVKKYGSKSKGSINKTTASVAKNGFSFFKSQQNATQAAEDFNSSATADLYGMFGFSDKTLIELDSDVDFDEDFGKRDYISLLPEEVLTNILCRLPFIDLSLNLNRVCLSWRDIINSSEVSAFHFYGFKHAEHMAVQCTL